MYNIISFFFFSMLKTYIEITYFFIIIYLSLFYIKLFRNVVEERRKSKTPIGSKSIKLERAIRAHSNFCENVPINFFLSLILYFNNLLFFAVPALIILSVGRTIHAKAISDINENLKLRVAGMRLTIYAIRIQLLGIVFYISQLIYVLFKTNIP